MAEQTKLLTKEIEKPRNEVEKRKKEKKRKEGRKLKKKERLVRGSIRADRHPKLLEGGKVKQVDIKYKGLEATLNPACLTDQLKAIFDTTEPKIGYNHGDRVEEKLVKEINGIVLDEIEEEGKNHIRMKFSALTASQFHGKMEKIMSYLDENGIQHGEKDGSYACIFACLTNKQLDLVDDFFKK